MDSSYTVIWHLTTRPWGFDFTGISGNIDLNRLSNPGYGANGTKLKYCNPSRTEGRVDKFSWDR
jgi:hypothetical protein